MPAEWAGAVLKLTVIASAAVSISVSSTLDPSPDRVACLRLSLTLDWIVLKGTPKKPLKLRLATNCHPSGWG
jgi:hypothetical protein